MPVKEDANKNETYKQVGRGNYLPAGTGKIEPKEMGDLGLRLMIDNMLSAIDGMGTEQLEAMGVSMRDVAKNRQKIEWVLLSVIQNDIRRLQRQQATNGAIRLVGHLRLQGAKETLITLLNSVHERPTLRTAAADALGLMRADEVGHVLIKHINDSHKKVANAAVVALGKVGGEISLEPLKRRLETTSDPAVLRNLHTAIRAIEEREGLDPSVEPYPLKKRKKRASTRILDDTALFDSPLKQ